MPIASVDEKTKVEKRIEKAVLLPIYMNHSSATGMQGTCLCQLQPTARRICYSSETIYILLNFFLMAVVFNSLKEKFGCHYQAVCSSDNQDVLTPSTEIDGQKD